MVGDVPETESMPKYFTPDPPAYTGTIVRCAAYERPTGIRKRCMCFMYYIGSTPAGVKDGHGYIHSATRYCSRHSVRNYRMM